MRIKDFQEEYVPINGITQYFLHYPLPKDTVAIILHGGPGQSEAILAHCFRPYWDFCSVVYYDQRGAGSTQRKSQSKPDELVIDTLIADLKETIRYVKEKYQAERVVLIGHSWGTVLGTQYIRQHPDDVIAYIGYGQVVDMLRGERAAYDELKKAVEKKGDKKDLTALYALNDYPYDVGSEDFLKSVLAFRRLQTKYGYLDTLPKILRAVVRSPLFRLSAVTALFAADALKRNKHLVDALLTYSVWDDAAYQTPIFYVLGKDDWQTPSVLAAEYFDRIMAPQKGLYWIENAKHMCDLDDPEAFCQSIRDILSKL